MATVKLDGGTSKSGKPPPSRFLNDPNVGRRTGIDVKAGKNIRKDEDGDEIFADYFSDKEGEESSFFDKTATASLVALPEHSKYVVDPPPKIVNPTSAKSSEENPTNCPEQTTREEQVEHDAGNQAANVALKSEEVVQPEVTEVLISHTGEIVFSQDVASGTEQHHDLLGMPILTDGDMNYIGLEEVISQSTEEEEENDEESIPLPPPSEEETPSRPSDEKNDSDDSSDTADKASANARNLIVNGDDQDVRSDVAIPESDHISVISKKPIPSSASSQTFNVCDKPHPVPSSKQESNKTVTKISEKILRPVNQQSSNTLNPKNVAENVGTSNICDLPSKDPICVSREVTGELALQELHKNSEELEKVSSSAVVPSVESEIKNVQNQDSDELLPHSNQNENVADSTRKSVSSNVEVQEKTSQDKLPSKIPQLQNKEIVLKLATNKAVGDKPAICKPNIKEPTTSHVEIAANNMIKNDSLKNPAVPVKSSATEEKRVPVLTTNTPHIVSLQVLRSPVSTVGNNNNNKKNNSVVETEVNDTQVKSIGVKKPLLRQNPGRSAKLGKPKAVSPSRKRYSEEIDVPSINHPSNKNDPKSPIHNKHHSSDEESSDDEGRVLMHYSFSQEDDENDDRSPRVDRPEHVLIDSPSFGSSSDEGYIRLMSKKPLTSIDLENLFSPPKQHQTRTRGRRKKIHTKTALQFKQPLTSPRKTKARNVQSGTIKSAKKSPRLQKISKAVKDSQTPKTKRMTNKTNNIPVSSKSPLIHKETKQSAKKKNDARRPQPKASRREIKKSDNSKIISPVKTRGRPKRNLNKNSNDQWSDSNLSKPLDEDWITDEEISFRITPAATAIKKSLTNENGAEISISPKGKTVGRPRKNVLPTESSKKNKIQTLIVKHNDLSKTPLSRRSLSLGRKARKPDGKNTSLLANADRLSGKGLQINNSDEASYADNETSQDETELTPKTRIVKKRVSLATTRKPGQIKLLSVQSRSKASALVPSSINNRKIVSPRIFNKKLISVSKPPQKISDNMTSVKTAVPKKRTLSVLKQTALHEIDNIEVPLSKRKVNLQLTTTSEIDKNEKSKALSPLISPKFISTPKSAKAAKEIPKRKKSLVEITSGNATVLIPQSSRKMAEKKKQKFKEGLTKKLPVSSPIRNIVKNRKLSASRGIVPSPLSKARKTKKKYLQLKMISTPKIQSLKNTKLSLKDKSRKSDFVNELMQVHLVDPKQENISTASNVTIQQQDSIGVSFLPEEGHPVEIKRPLLQATTTLITEIRMRKPRGRPKKNKTLVNQVNSVPLSDETENGTVIAQPVFVSTPEEKTSPIHNESESTVVVKPPGRIKKVTSQTKVSVVNGAQPVETRTEATSVAGAVLNSLPDQLESEENVNEMSMQATTSQPKSYKRNFVKSRERSPNVIYKKHRLENTTDSTLSPVNGSMVASVSSLPRKSKFIPIPRKLNITPGVRRSRRPQLKPLQFWRQERLVYKESESGNSKMLGIDTGRENLIGMSPQTQIISARIRREKRQLKNIKLTKKRSRKHDKSEHNLSIHNVSQAKSGLELTMTDPPPANTVNLYTGEEDQLEIVRSHRTMLWVGPDGKPGVKTDPYIITKFFNQGCYSSGFLKIRPSQAKPLQLQDGHLMTYVIKFGKLKVQVHQNVWILETDDIFRVPDGNMYRIENLRHDEATLTFFSSPIADV